MKKKFGFTLIELLAVIIVLALVLVIAIPSVNKYLKNSKEKAYRVQMDTIIDAVETYANTYRELLPDNHGEEVRVTLGQLKTEGLVKNNIKDPKTDNPFEDSMEMMIRRNGNNYIYKIDDSTIKTRTTSYNSPTITLKGKLVETYYVGETFIDAGSEAYDYAGNILSNITLDPASKTFDTPGIYKIKYKVTDKNGVETVAIRNVIVKESEL